jgi:hypothetical protein
MLPSDLYYISHFADVADSDISRGWMERLRSSDLLTGVSKQFISKLPTGQVFRRPKIAIVDTGYDGILRCLKKTPVKARLNPHNQTGNIQHHWKDCWSTSREPCNDDGHGTSMLSLVLEIAPFANICVARIAAKDADLYKHPFQTSKSLAEVCARSTLHST